MLLAHGLLVDHAAADRPAAPRPAAPQAPAPQPAGQFGRLVRISLPIKDRGDDLAKRAILRALARLRSQPGAADARLTLILELSRGQTESGLGNDFFRSLSLARFLTSRQLVGVKTVAYLPHSVKGHAVLVAMACDEIAMAPEAEFGEAGLDEDPNQPIDATVLAGYRQIAESRRTIHPDIALSMLDRHVGLWKVETESGAEFVLDKDLEALRQRKAIQGQPEEIVARGELAKFSARRARDLGLVRYLAADRMSVARALELPAEALEEDPLVDGELHPVTIMLEGRIDSRLAETRRRMIAKSLLDPRINMIFLWIDSPGGEAEPAIQLARHLAEQDPARIMTVAYVPHEARGVAALVALSCDQLVMHRSAGLGGGEGMPTDRELLDLRSALKDDILSRRKRSWSLPLSLIDAKLPVYQYTNLRSNLQEYFSTDELDQQPDRDDWKRGRQVTLDGRPLSLSADEAQQLGLVRERGVVDGFEQVKAIYGLQNDPALVEPSWVDDMVRILASPGVAWLLLMIGLAGLYVELHTPGLGIGGFLAAVSFMLFFWSHYLEQTAGVLEIVLFVTGITFLVLELFIIPGFGIFGLGGGMMIIVSLVLASQTFVIPATAGEVRELRDSLLVVGGAGVGFIALSLLLRRYLPHTPLFQRMLLEPPQGEQAAQQLAREAMVDYHHLLGTQGRTATQLTPSGKARFGEQLVDVISDGQLIPPGSTIVVVEVHGNRVIVEQVG